MSLFTGKGDDGTTYAFGSNKRFLKNSALAEALGSVDEINSYLGFVKLECKNVNFKISSDKHFPEEISFFEIVDKTQKDLFIIQAELAGADKNISDEKVSKMSELINIIEEQMPPIKTFFVSGGTKLSSLFDFSRTIARRAERKVVALSCEKDFEINKNTLAYLNRLSSLLYAMARLSNHLSGIKEEAPDYN